MSHENHVHSTLANTGCAFYYRMLFHVHVGDWIRDRFETPGCFQMTNEEKQILLARLVRSTRYVYLHLYMLALYNVHVHVPPEAAFFFEKYCLGRVVLCCFVFLLCCVTLPFFLSISWMIKKSCMYTGFL